jgi:iron complex transport system substrate-binding protein
MDMLGVVDTLAGVDRFEYINSARVWERIEEGAVVEVTSSEDGRPGIQLLLDMAPDVIMTSGTGDRWDEYPYLMEANLPVVLNGEWDEKSPLGRAEWMKFMALFYNEEKKAENIFGAIADEYHRLEQLASAFASEAAKGPLVMSGSPYRGEWFVPSKDSSTAAYIEDAGGRYVWGDVEKYGVLTLTFEEVFTDAKQAPIWINAGGGWETFGDVLKIDERIAGFRSFQLGNIYTNEKRVNTAGGNDFWESGVVNPHLILADLISVFHPDILPGHTLIYYKKLRWE